MTTESQYVNISTEVITVQRTPFVTGFEKYVRVRLRFEFYNFDFRFKFVTKKYIKNR